ncbi:MAG: 2-hydroxyacid dehydrogenase, partial [Sciscionella sp.]
MKVLLPFSADRLPAAPDGFTVTTYDIDTVQPDEVADTQFYVPTYMSGSKPAELVTSMPQLRVVQTLTAGVDNIVPYVPAGVLLCNAAGVHDAATSELAVGMMIAAQRRFVELVRAQDKGAWDVRVTPALADSRILVVGAGHIAHALARRLDGFECQVTLVGRTARDGIRGIDELPYLLPKTDIVVLLVPLTDQTEGMVDEAFLAALPDGALVVNVARGKVVVTEALLAELRSGRLRACLDVTDPEPLPPDHDLWSAPGVFITPHEGGAAYSMWPRA